MGDKNHSTTTRFFKSSKEWFYEKQNDKKVFFLQVAIVLTCFQSEKSQNKLDLMQSFLPKRLTKLVNINLRGRKTKKSHLSNYPFSFCLNLYQKKKEEIWLSPMTKAPTPTEMSKGQSDNTNNATKKFD